MNPMTALQRAVEILADSPSVLITTHVRPDGDAVGSVVGLLRLLRGAGRRAEGVLLDETPPRYAFLTEGAGLQRWERGRGANAAADIDLLCIVDTSARSQLEPIASLLAGPAPRRLVIDHHQTRDPIGHDEVIDETAPAASLLVLRIAEAAGWPLAPAIAEPLFVGLATDTGWFRFSNTSADAFAAAARLVAAGARPDRLYERLYQSDPSPRMRLLGRLLTEMQLLAEGRLAVLTLPKRLLAECGGTAQMTEELVNEPQRIGSVAVVALFAEDDGGVTRVSLRSRGGVDVAAVCRRYGGGGHAQAAGARVTGPLEQVSQRVVRDVLDALANPSTGAA